MTARYRATVNVVVPVALNRVSQTGRFAWVDGVHATMAAKVDRHMILGRSSWNPTGSPSVFVLTFTYDAAGDGEAVSIIHDAAREAGVSYDAVRVTRGAGRRTVTV